MVTGTPHQNLHCAVIVNTVPAEIIGKNKGFTGAKADQMLADLDCGSYLLVRGIIRADKAEKRFSVVDKRDLG